MCVMEESTRCSTCRHRDQQVVGCVGGHAQEIGALRVVATRDLGLNEVAMQFPLFALASDPSQRWRGTCGRNGASKPPIRVAWWWLSEAPYHSV